MKVTCVGADPAALYLGILLKRKNPAHAVHFLEAGADVSRILPSIACNPLRPQFQLQDAEVREEIGKFLAKTESVSVSTPQKDFSAAGFRYAYVDPAGVTE